MKKTVIYYPQNSKNEYVNKMVDAFRVIGYKDSRPFSIKEIVCADKEKTIFFFNWIENLAQKKPITGTIKIILVLALLAIFRKRYIWVLHNRNFHYSTRLQNMAGRLAQSLLQKRSFKTICHGLITSSENSFCYVPHPAYPVCREPNQRGSEYYLCFGRMMRYKRLETMILSWPETEKLKIVGKFDEHYLDEVMAISRNMNNVSIFDEFVKQDKLESLIKKSKGIVVPNDGESSIVSGAIFLSLRLGRPVYITSKNMLREIGQNVIGLYYIKSWKDLRSKNYENAEDILRFANKEFGLDTIARSLQDCIKDTRD